jgi:fermentation-respiration switch protein FrsA (DUF1100 family)
MPSLLGFMKTRLIDVILRPTWGFSPLALDLLRLRTGADLSQVRPGAFIAKISPRPIMLIDGLDDTTVGPRFTIANFRLARAPKTLWLVPGETHEGMISPHGAATTARVSAFFASALLSPHRGRMGADSFTNRGQLPSRSRTRVRSTSSH